MLLGTVAASSTGTINLTWLPAFIHADIATVPTSLQVSVLGDGIISDLDGAGINAVTRSRRVGTLADQYMIPLADGQVNKNTTITIANAQASTLSLYGGSSQMAKGYFQTLTQYVLANSGQNIADFFELYLPSMGASDVLTVFYENGFSQILTREDLKMNSSFTTYVADDVYDIRLQNYNQAIRRVNFVPAAAQNVYVLKGRGIGNLS